MNNNQQDDLDPEITRKRRNTTTTTTTTTTTQEYQPSRSRINQNLDHHHHHHHHNHNHDDDQEEQGNNDLLALSLSIRPPSSRPRLEIPDDESSHAPHPHPHPHPPSPIPQPCSMQTRLVSQSPPQLPLQISSPTSSHSLYIPPFMVDIPTPAAPPPPPSRRLRSRRNPAQAPGEGKGDTVPALYPWATTQRATVHSFSYLLSKHITTVKGEVQCKKCEKQFEMGYDLRDKFREVYRFVVENRSTMHDRAPIVWMNPVLPTCKFCDQVNSAKPVIPDKKKQINWLFLLLGQLLGCCTLDQLKYFCKHTKNHRTGAKDRVLYLTYLALCKQLDPTGPFGR